MSHPDTQYRSEEISPKASWLKVSPNNKIILKFHSQTSLISNFSLTIDKKHDISEKTVLGKEQERIWKAKVKSLLKKTLIYCWKKEGFDLGI